MDWLVASIVLSVVLTVLLNAALRAFPGAGDAIVRRLAGPADRDERRVGVWIPWKGMLIASAVLTMLLNLALLVS